MKKNIISGLLYIIIILIFCIDIHTNNPVFFMWLCFMAGYTKNIWDFDKYLAKQRFDDTESKNELVHNLLEELNFKKIKGGNLSELKVQKELLANDQKQLTRSQELVTAGVVPKGDLLDVKATVAADNQRVVAAENVLFIY